MERPWLCTVLLGTRTDEPMQIRKDRHERVRELVENDPHTRRRKGARQERGRVDSRVRKKMSN